MEAITQQIIFWILGITIITAAIGVIAASNTINSVMSLLVVMLAAAGFYMFMGAPVVALFQIIIYVGAVLVLFLFIIMLLNPDATGLSMSRKLSVWMAGIASVGMTVVIGWIFWQSATQTNMQDVMKNHACSCSIHDISVILFSRHLLIFELTSLLLLVAAVGALLMTKKTREDRS